MKVCELAAWLSAYPFQDQDVTIEHEESYIDVTAIALRLDVEHDDFGTVNHICVLS